MVDPNTNKYLNLVKNREPVVSGQLLAIVSAIILSGIDRYFTFSSDPVLTSFVVYIVSVFVWALWARFKVWSPESVAALEGANPPAP
jgi:hypothetical protein